MIAVRIRLQCSLGVLLVNYILDSFLAQKNMLGILCFLATFAGINAGETGTLKQRDGFHYITGKGCGISTPIKYLDEIPDNIEGMSCTIIRPKKITKSQDQEGLQDHLKFKPIESKFNQM